MTPDLSNNQELVPYTSDEQVVVGTGMSLPILNVGTFVISSSSSSKSIQLNNVLHTPYLSHNLISMAKLCHDNHAYVEFQPNVFFVKDLHTKTTLFRLP